MRVRPSEAAPQPTVVVSTITPFPFWVVILSIVIFIPLALIVAFWVKRQLIVVNGDSLAVLQVSLWRYRIEAEPLNDQLGKSSIELDGKVLVIDGERFHLEPGWLESAEKLVELNSAAAAAAE